MLHTKKDNNTLKVIVSTWHKLFIHGILKIKNLDITKF